MRCRLLNISTLWVEILCPLLCLFLGGRWPSVRVVGAAVLATMHISFGVMFRLGNFSMIGLACALLVRGINKCLHVHFMCVCMIVCVFVFVCVCIAHCGYQGMRGLAITALNE